MTTIEFTRLDRRFRVVNEAYGHWIEEWIEDRFGRKYWRRVATRGRSRNKAQDLKHYYQQNKATIAAEAKAKIMLEAKTDNSRDITYTVKGLWPFPEDMLRRDLSSPSNDSTYWLIRDLTQECAPDAGLGPYEVTLRIANDGRWTTRWDRERFMPNIDRWKSFGWNVVRIDGKDVPLPETVVSKPEPNIWLINAQEIIKQAVYEYLLLHPMEDAASRVGRRAAIRGMMVRLKLYDIFTKAIAECEAEEARLKKEIG